MKNKVDERENLTARQFHDEYLSRCKPVLLRGLASNCRAVREWTLDFFAERYGDLVVHVTHRDEAREAISLAQYINKLHDGDVTAGYLRDWKIADFDREIFDYIPKFDHFSVDYLENLSTTNDFLKEIFIGPVGASTFMHVDIWESHSWMLLVSGLKRWIMCPPGEIDRAGIKRDKNSSRFQREIENRLHELNYIEFELRPGDIVYVPSGWWHHVSNIENSIAVTYNFIDAYSLTSGYRLADANSSLFDAMVQKELQKLPNEHLSDESNIPEAWQRQALADALNNRAQILSDRASKLAMWADKIRRITDRSN